MTMRTEHKLVCGCGHVGMIRMSENDQPYSKCWESYTLADLEGGSFQVEGRSADWEEVFSAMHPHCPKCKAALTEENMK